MVAEAVAAEDVEVVAAVAVSVEVLGAEVDLEEVAEAREDAAVEGTEDAGE